MADGGGRPQRGFNFPLKALTSALREGEIVVDLFAGGGGASEGLEEALGRPVDIAVNHDPVAVGMHAANHPFTRHLREDVWAVDPISEVAGRQIGWFHASPDCRDFSQAKGGQPRSKVIRSLSWVVCKWAGRLNRLGLAPRIISLENVLQVTRWTKLVAKRDKATGRVIKLDEFGDVVGVAEPGERVPLDRQFLVPDKRSLGRTWKRFVAILEGLGYVVEWRVLNAADYGAGTERKRLFLVARRDGEPIQWPVPTHGQGRANPAVSAADCIDWTIPTRSIFNRDKDLVPKSMQRLAKGIRKFVLETDDPYLIRTPDLLQIHQAQALSGCVAKIRGNSIGTALQSGLPVITSGGGAKRPAGAAHALGLVTAFLEQANGGFYDGAGKDVRRPMSTITKTAAQQRLVTAHMAACGADGERQTAAVGESARLRERAALQVAKFLVEHGGMVPRDDSVQALLKLVTVVVDGIAYMIVDVGMRMLKPHELFKAQGFGPHYIIDRTADGTPLSNSAANKMVGNSVSPHPMAALVRSVLGIQAAPLAQAA